MYGQEKKRECLWLQSHLFGYRKSKEDKHKLVINIQEARVVKRIFNEYNNGKQICDIIDGLQKDKIPSPNNNCNNGEIRNNWRTETIRRILINQLYLGHTQYGKRVKLSYKSKKVKYIPPEEWKMAYNTHEAIIDEDLFNSVQRKININKTIKRKKYNWELNGIVKCKECGEKMTLKVKYKKANSDEIKSKKIYCLNGIKKHQGKNCIRGCKGINEETLNIIILQNLKNVLNKVIENEKIKELIIKRNRENQQCGILNGKEQLYKELKKNEEEAKTVYADYRKELLDEEDYKRFYQEIKNSKNRIKKEIEIIEKEEQEKNLFDASKSGKIIREIMDMKGINKNIISDIIYDVEIDNENKIYINYKYDIFKDWYKNEGI